MEIIAELEAVGRGAYTGSIGYLNRDGSCDLNILIRTITAQGGRCQVSRRRRHRRGLEPAQELAETRAKAEGLLRALAPAPRREHLDQRPAGHVIDCRDRGLQYGDGAVRDHAGAPAAGPLAGLSSRAAVRRDAGGLGSAAPSARALRRELDRARGDAREGVLKLIVTRGAGARGYRPSGRERCTRMLSLHPAAAAARERGVEPVRVRLCATPLGIESRLGRP